MWKIRLTMVAGFLGCYLLSYVAEPTTGYVALSLTFGVMAVFALPALASLNFNLCRTTNTINWREKRLRHYVRFNMTCATILALLGYAFGSYQLVLITTTILIAVASAEILMAGSAWTMHRTYVGKAGVMYYMPWFWHYSCICLRHYDQYLDKQGRLTYDPTVAIKFHGLHTEARAIIFTALHQYGIR